MYILYIEILVKQTSEMWTIGHGGYGNKCLKIYMTCKQDEESGTTV